MIKVTWEQIYPENQEGVFPEGHIYRTRVPDGWFVVARFRNTAMSSTFIPDKDNKWK